MNKIFVGALSYLMLCTNCVATASEFPLMELPQDLLVYTSQFLNTNDACSLTQVNKRLAGLGERIRHNQLPHMYAAIGKDHNKSIIQLPHPRGKIADALPSFMRILVHQWYFKGRAQEDPYKRFCYLMAAGRAGHHYAAIEAGELLIDSKPEAELLDQENRNVGGAVIPCLVTLEDLMRIVPELSIPAVQEWQISKLEEKIIASPELREFYEDHERSVNKMSYDKDVLVNNPKSVEEAIKYLHEIIKSIEDLFDENLQRLACIQAYDQEEYLALKEYLSYMKTNYEFSYFKDCINRYGEALPILEEHDPNNRSENLSVNDHEERSSLKIYLPGLHSYMQEKQNQRINHDAKKSATLYSLFMNLPIYWQLQDQICIDNDFFSQRQGYLERLVELNLSGESFRKLAHATYINYRVAQNSEPGITLELFNKLYPLQLSACLLGDDLDSSYFLKYIDDAKSGKNEAEGTMLLEQQRLEDSFAQWNPMTAFVMQLNILRSPDNHMPYVIASEYYKSYIKRDGEVITQARAEAMANLINIIEGFE